MPAKSKKQQRFFGVVTAYLEGKIKNPSPSVVRAANSMSKEDIKHFASTKHDGLPEEKDAFFVTPTIAVLAYLYGRKHRKDKEEDDSSEYVQDEKKAWASTKVHLQNKFAQYDFDSIEDAASFLASIGTLSEDDLLDMLYGRQELVNGFAVTYSSEKSAQSKLVDPYRKYNKYDRAEKVVDAVLRGDGKDDTEEAKKKHRKELSAKLDALVDDIELTDKAISTLADLLN